MNIQNAKMRRCPSCRGADLLPATYVREFLPHGQSVTVELLTSQCPSCAAKPQAAQHHENLVRLKARKGKYNGLLLGEEILALRRRYGITQQTAAKIFGKGKIAFSRYENETSYPDDTTTKLLKVAIQKPDVIKSLRTMSVSSCPCGTRVVRTNVEPRCACYPMELPIWRRSAGRTKELLGAVPARLTTSFRLPLDIQTWDEEIVSGSANDDHYGSLGNALA